MNVERAHGANVAKLGIMRLQLGWSSVPLPGCSRAVSHHDRLICGRYITIMRIIAGKFADRTLTSPNDFRVHPTAELVRGEMLRMLKPDLAGARVLDLFAGTGALGLEAISRGARNADFVETRPASLHALRANIAALRLNKFTRVFKRDALPMVAAMVADSYDVAFADPPYGSKMLDRVLESWHTTRFSRVLAVEHARDHDLPLGDDRRRFDTSTITIYRR